MFADRFPETMLFVHGLTAHHDLPDHVFFFVLVKGLGCVGGIVPLE